MKTIEIEYEPYMKVRVLPYDTPGIPASVPYVPGVGRDIDAMCCSELPAHRVPLEEYHRLSEGDPSVVGFICSLPHHDDDMHACHLLTEEDEPLALIVWGGE